MATRITQRPWHFCCKVPLAWLIAALFMLLGARTLQAQGCVDGACVHAGSQVVSVDSTQSALLDALLGNLLDVDVSLDATAVTELAQGQIELAELLAVLQSELALSSPQAALMANVDLSTLLTALQTVAQAQGATDLAALFAGLSAEVQGLTETIQLSALLQLDPELGDAPAVTLKALDLVTGVVQLYNYQHRATPSAAVTIDGAVLNLGGLNGKVGQLALQALVLEHPVFRCGPTGALFNSAALRLHLTVQLLDLALPTTDLVTGLLGNISVPGATITAEAAATVGSLSLYVDLARGTGVIAALDALVGAVSVEATPGVANLYLGNFDPTLAFSRTHVLDPVTDLDFAPIGVLTVVVTSTVGIPPLAVETVLVDVAVGIEARSSAEGSAPTATTLVFSGPYPEVQSASAGATYATDLVTELVTNTELQLESSLGLLLDPLLNGTILPLLKSATEGILSPLLDDIVTDLVDPLIEALGIQLGVLTVSVDGMLKLCPDLAIAKQHLGAFNAGGSGLYTVTVENIGAYATSGPIVVIDSLPTGLSLVNTSGAGWGAPNINGNIVTVTATQVLSPAVALPPLLFSVAVSDQVSGVVTNTVTVSTTGDLSVTNNLAVDPTNILAVDPTDSDGDGLDDDDEDDLGTDPQDVDSDGDGVHDNFEVGDPNNPRNTDGDGLIDALDPDDDGDGVLTKFEAPDPNSDGNPADARNSDGAGQPDYLDPDDDDDAKPTNTEQADPNNDGDPADAQDADGDGQPNYLDNADGDGPLGDNDGDGLTNGQEGVIGTDPNNVDSDGDGVHDNFEVGDVNNPRNTDGDSLPDPLDGDDEGDHVPTTAEQPDPNGDGNPADARNTDGDGQPDYLDTDDDGDGIPTADEDPNNDGNPTNDDSDGDGIPDYLDDQDDGLPNAPRLIYMPVIGRYSVDAPGQ